MSSGFPPFTLVTASSEAVLHGFDEPARADFAGGCFCQFIPVGSNALDRVDFLLAAEEPCSAEIEARIFRGEPPEGGGDPVVSGLERPLAEGRLPWTGAGECWVQWPVGLTPRSGIKVGHYIRLELELPPGIGWMRNHSYERAFPAGVVTPGGAVATPTPGSTFCFRVEPAQPCFWAANILPKAPDSNRFTGIWKSHPERGFPQWLELSWRDPELLEQLEIHFSDSPECPLSYRVEVTGKSGDKRAVLVEGNQQELSLHPFRPPALVDSVRIEFFAARGGPSVSVKEIRARMGDEGDRGRRPGEAGE